MGDKFYKLSISGHGLKVKQEINTKTLQKIMPNFFDDYISDDHGNVWPKHCTCGGENQIVRPGKIQCSECG